MSRLVWRSMWRAALLGATLGTSALSAQVKLPPVPDSTGWGVHVLTVARDPRGGALGRHLRAGHLSLKAGAKAWERITQ